MRFTIIVLAGLCFPAFASAQARPEIKSIQVGFKTATPNLQLQAEDQTVFKVGLWTPVYVELFGGANGIKPSATEVPYIDIETEDSEGVGTRIRVPVQVDANDTRTFLSYIKTGHRGGSEFKVTLHVNGRDLQPRVIEPFSSLDVDANLYLTLGNKINHLQQAVRTMDQPAAGKENDPNDLRFDPNAFRQVAFENKVERLPEAWFGYNGIDLVILLTGNDKFLTELNRADNAKRLRALAQWVRRGGRLVVPMSPATQATVSTLLKSPAWDPAIPVTPPGVAQRLTLKTVNVSVWGGVQEHPFQREDPKTKRIEVATLDPGKVAPGDWTVLADSGPEGDKSPLIAQVRYGLGQITYMAFSLEDNHFFQWPGKEKFLQTMIQKLAPRTAGQNRDFDRFANRRDNTDPATELLGMLDNFDVKVIPFGYVALFIVLYILVVGPLDFIILKFVLKRLEWTWITFPVVVLGVSVLAYFAAYALKGRDLKINKVDIVDFDMRTDPKSVNAYGSSFFTILSPRIQNYTIGVEPNPEFWGEKADKVRSVDLLGWMGRPSGGPHDMGRGGSAGFFRKPYTIRADAAALEGVPIPVWTTKAFSASWEQTLKTTPFVVDLVYHTRPVQGKELKVSGKLENHLAVDLIDVWLLYDDNCYPIHGGLKSVPKGGQARPIVIDMVGDHISNFQRPRDHVDEATEPRVWSSEPTPLVKRILFHERIDTQNTVRNHLLRPLDQGWRTWRVEEERAERRTREAILFARVRHVAGAAEAVTSDAERPLATKLWLGDTPAPGKSRPTLNGHLNQDTYIRVILPVRPAD
jgi:hypothetical protein